MSRELLRAALRRDEGTGPKKLGRFMPYRDTVGKLTVGYGWNLDDNGIPQTVADWLLEYAIDEASSELLKRWPWLAELDGARYAVLVNMMVNIGGPRLAGFRKMLAALKKQDYYAASEEMLDSKWAEQVGNRAYRLSRQMRTGEWA
jgi:lysozyme